MNIGLSEFSMWLFKLSWLTNLTCVWGGSLTKPKNFWIYFYWIQTRQDQPALISPRLRSKNFSVLPMAVKITFLGLSKNFRALALAAAITFFGLSTNFRALCLLRVNCQSEKKIMGWVFPVLTQGDRVTHLICATTQMLKSRIPGLRPVVTHQFLCDTK